MSKSVKYILITLVSLVVLIAVAAGIFIATFDPNSYKAQVQDLVKKQTNRQLQIDGDISLKVFPNIALVVNDAALMEADNTQEFISIKQTSVGVALMPLLSKKVIADSINIDGLVANIVTDKNGNFNFDDLLKTKDKTKDDSEPADPKQTTGGSNKDKSQSQDLQIDIAGINITNSTVSVINHVNNSNILISNLDAKTGAINLDKPISLKLKGHIKANQPSLDTNFDLATNVSINNDIYELQKLVLNVDGALTDFSFKPAKLQTDITFNQGKNSLSVNGLGLNVNGGLGGNTKINDMVLNAKATQILLDLNNNLNSDDTVAMLLGGKGISINNLSGDFKAKKINASDIDIQSPQLDFTLSKGKLTADNIKANLYDGTITGKYSLNAKKAMTVNANVAGINVGNLAKDYLKEERLSGKGNITANLTMHGFEVNQILNSLSGSVQTSIDNGAWQGVDLEQTIEEVRQAIKDLRSGKIPSISKTNDDSKHTEFDQLQAQAKITNGVADINSLLVATKKLEVTQGKPAKVNLPASKVDLVINIQKRLADGSIPSQPENVNLDKLEGVIIPVHVYGPFDSLSYKVNTSDLAKTVLKGALQGDLVDGIKDLLGGKSSGDDKKTDATSKKDSKKINKDSVKDIGKSLKGLFK